MNGFNIVIVLGVLFLSVTHTSSAQINASYSLNKHTCDCINISIKNESKDSVYVVSQSNSIYNWDSCFTYDVSQSTLIENSHNLNVTNVDFDNDNYWHRYIFILPDSTYTFGARSNREILAGVLSLSVYVNSVFIKDISKIEEIRSWETKKMKKRKFIPGWEWRSIYANREQ